MCIVKILAPKQCNVDSGPCLCRVPKNFQISLNVACIALLYEVK